MKQIPLTQGACALVDDGDYDWLSQFTWFLCIVHHGRYARTTRIIDPNRRVRYMMHRLVAAARDDEVVDHKDRNTLNNQRFNLRVGTDFNNMANSTISRANTSGFKGVCWNKVKEKWQANIRTLRDDGTRVRRHLGLFDDSMEAARAYDAAAILHKGEFALTNKMMGLL